MSLERGRQGGRACAALLSVCAASFGALFACGGDSSNTLLSGGAAGWSGGDPGGTWSPPGNTVGAGGDAAAASPSPPAAPGPASDAGWPPGPQGGSGGSSSGGAGSSGGSGGGGPTFGGSGSGGGVADAGGAGDDGEAAAPGAGPITFALIDTSVTGIVEGSPVPGFDPLPDNAIVYLAMTGSTLSVRATTVPSRVGSVRFSLDSNLHTEDDYPYFLCSDDGAGNINDCHLQAGWHTLTATLFSAPRHGGTQGPSATVHFTVVGDGGDGGSSSSGY